MKKKTRLKLSIMMAFLMVISTFVNYPITTFAATTHDNTKNQIHEEDPDTYTIYPNPHKITYSGEISNVTDSVNIVYDKNVDKYTKDRVKQILQAKKISFTESSKIAQDKTNFLVGIYGSNGYVDNYFADKDLIDKDTLGKIDANIISIKDNVIAVLGKDVDSAFYGVTTIKHIFKQMAKNTIKELTIKDYADVKGRGFIEGYYGEPWSDEDRMDLMTYGGEFKMNSYIYAPKDDPKHNAKWRELYTKEELVDIKKLAEAGNKSKTRFVYTLHPFMSNAIRFDTEENYQNDLNVIKDKFTQLLDAGVRKFGILADDSRVPPQGPTSYVKLMKDLTNWLIEKQDEYDGLVTDMVFCPNDYMGWGTSNQIQALKELPDSVSLIQTGGRVWGQVSNNFTQTFTENAGRGPFLWINWPCTDNSKQHLIMGGNDVFLHPKVKPENIEGIVLNPMQQSEPSKVAIFANADYAWHIWDNKEQAQQNWNDSFAYMDHLNINKTKASNALRELSKHMINQDMDSRVAALEESVELAPKLDAFKKDLNKENITEKAEDLIKEFEIIRDAAITYKKAPGNKRLRDQMIYWLDSAKETADAAIYLLKAEIADEQGNDPIVWDNYSAGHASFNASKSHSFRYIDHDENAEVGVQHIVPFINTLLSDVSNKVKSIINPDFNTANYITNRTDKPTGDIANVLDNNPNTEVVYKSPNEIKKGTYIGVLYQKSIKINTIRFELGRVGNKDDTFTKSKIQYTVDGKKWEDLAGATFDQVDQIKLKDVDLKARGIRLIATANHTGTWLGVRDIVINEEKKADNGQDKLDYKLMIPEHFSVYQGSEDNLFDGNDKTFVWYNPSGEKKDTSVAGDYIGVDLGKITDIGQVYFAVGQDTGDKWTKYQLEYSNDNKNYTTYKVYNGKKSGMDKIQEDMTGISARYIRLENLKDVPVWVKFSEIKVEQATKGVSGFTYTNNAKYKGIKADHTLEETSLHKKDSITLKPDEYLGVKLERLKELKSVTVSETSGKLTLQASPNGVEWQKPTKGMIARYVRLVNQTDKAVTFDLTKFVVPSNEMYGPSFIETTMGINQNYADKDSRNNGTLMQLFDKDFSTKTNFSDYQKKDGYITYSLGEAREINSLRIYNEENTINYIRDAKVQLSMDKKNWQTVAEIGDGKNNLADGTQAYEDMIKDGYTHDSKNPGNYYFGNDNINHIKAKYIRILFTADYNARFVQINEILINNGEFVKMENDPTFVADPIEQEGFGPKNLLDDDLTTAFKPNMTKSNSGSLLYRLSEKTDVTAITFVQGLDSISNAIVNVRVGKDKWIKLGVLDKSLKTFYNTKYKHIFDVKLTWKNIQPVIYEMNLSTNKDLLPTVDKEGLDKLIKTAKKINEKDFTVESWKAFKKQLEKAQTVAADKKATQDDVDQAVNNLQEAMDKLEEKQTIDKTALANLITSAEKKKEENYTTASWKAFKKQLEKAQTVEADKNATQDDVDQAVNNLQEAMDNLIENSEINAETLKGLVNQLAEKGAFAKEQAQHALLLHLTAVSHYENKDDAEKVIKHMDNGFKKLLAHQKDKNLITIDAYNKLITQTNKLIEKWR